MNRLQHLLSYVRSHKYGITIAIFLVIYLFIDENSYMRQRGYSQEISVLQDEIKKYRAEFEESTAMLKELDENPDAIEQIAREKYLMKKSNEDIFIIED